MEGRESGDEAGETGRADLGRSCGYEEFGFCQKQDRKTQKNWERGGDWSVLKCIKIATVVTWRLAWGDYN